MKWTAQYISLIYIPNGRYTVPNRTQFFLLISVISGNLLCTLILGFIFFSVNDVNKGLLLLNTIQICY